MRRALYPSLLLIALFLVTLAFAQTPPAEGDITVTSADDPIVKVIPSSVELNAIHTAAPHVRICYAYIRQSGAVARTECIARTNGDPATTTDDAFEAFGDVLVPRTSTAQPPNSQRRILQRVKAWTQTTSALQ